MAMPEFARSTTNLLAEAVRLFKKDQADQVFMAVIESFDGNMIYIQRYGQTIRDEQPYPLAYDGEAVDYQIGDRVIMLRIGKGYAVLAKMRPA